MHKLLVIATVCAAIVLGACQRSQVPEAAAATPPSEAVRPPADSGAVTRDYQCAEVGVTAVYHGEGPVDLTFPGTALSLPHVVSGSGARYADDKGNEFWSKGEEAMFTIAGQQMRKCTPAGVPTAATPSAGDEYPLARDACVAAVAKGTGIEASKLKVTEVLWAQAGVGVTIQVPGSQAPWSCLSDEKGHVQGVRPLGSDGAA